ncbi:MAG: leucine-rich repeat domain-containing protein, partial [Prevotella sp.]|nr:leucine-rich repeat domain-containing protein [Prevotella sp.]
MKRFLHLAFLCYLFSNVAVAAEEGDIIKDTNGVAYEITSLDAATVSVALQSDNDGVTSGDVVIPETVTYDGTDYTVTGTVKYAFKSAEITSVTLPGTLSDSNLGGYEFYKCGSLVSAVISEGCTKIPSYMFYFCKVLKEVTLPSTLTSIATKAFYDCEALTSIVIPSGVTAIESSTFAYCYALESISLPATTTSIGTQAFYYCTSLTSITIPSEVTSIAYDAFRDCSSLESIVMEATTPPTLNGTQLKDVPENLVIVVPDGCKESYEEAWGDYYTYVEASEDWDNNVSSIEGTSLGDMAVGTADSREYNGYGSLTSGDSYYITYTPSANGTLYTTGEFTCYDNFTGGNVINGTYESNGKNAWSFKLTAGTTYYFVFTAEWTGSESFTSWYEEEESENNGDDTGVSYEFSIVSVTAANGTDLTSNITAEGKLDLAVLEDGMQMVINCTNASGYYLDIVFGTVGTEQYLTQTSDRLTADEDGNFTWTGGYDYELTEGYVYPVVCELYDAEHNGNLLASATVLTLVGTSPNTVSSVRLVSSDPGTDEEIEVEDGEDLVITLTFSDYVNIGASISQGLSGSISLDATGVEDTGDGNGYYTTWTITIPASELADEDYGGGITIAISGTDSEGMTLFDASGYMTMTYYYTLTSDDVDITLTFDPANGSTVTSLSTISVTAGEGYTLKYVSYESSFPIYKDGKPTSYELYNNEDIESGDSGARETEEDTEEDVSGLVFSIADTSDIVDEENNIYNWNAEITEEGTYTITLPTGTFKVNSTVFDEEITLTYIISSTSNEGGEDEGNEGDENGGTETGISAIQAAIANGAEVYTISGQKVNAPVNGVNIVKYADGTVKKILQK